jgi:diguanylate cyclase (GGDEF)-like protein/hemerythrin-like metal-binding protein/PAS domain S-box-containing protein
MEMTARALDALSVPAFIIGRDHRVLAWNAACAQLTGYDAEYMIGTEFQWKAFYRHRRPCLADLVVDNATDDIDTLYDMHGKGQFAFDAYKAEGWFDNINGKRRYLVFEARPLIGNEAVMGAVEMLQDITEYKETSDQLRLAMSVFENTGEGIMVTDTNNRIVSINNAFKWITGYDDDIVGTDPRLLGSTRHPPEFFRDMWNNLREAGHWQGEIWNKRKDGEEYLARMHISVVSDNDEVINYVAVFSDITKHKEAEDRIAFMAHHDFLTGLPNRILLEDRMSQLVARSGRGGEGFATAFLDLDKFKLVNDALGHDIGDKLLKEVAARLKASVRATDTVSRQGGDEFVLLLTGLQDVRDLSQVATKIAAKLSEPYEIGGHQLIVTPSIGISVFPADGNTPAELIREADAAMYHAKSTGRNNFQFFTSELNAKVREALVIESSLKAAVPDQLFVQYQPQLDLATQAAFGVEALVRWRHPTMGVIGPDRFIPRAESSGMIKDIGRWVLQQSCSLIARSGIKTSVNLSPVQLAQKDILAVVKEAVEGIDCRLLTFEITEGAFINDFDNTKKVLDKFRELGIGVALDDFGTGYSSLSYLRKLPIDYIKIDKSFIWDVKARSIVQAIISLADSLGMSTVAEGVESPEQMAFLERHGCSVIQGYYFSKPLEEARLHEFWKAHCHERRPREVKRTNEEPLLTWSFTFSTGIAAVDGQHRNLISIINRLHGHSGDPDQVRASVAELLDYTLYHFGFEQGLMERYSLGCRPEHLAEHTDFVDQARSFAKALDREPTMVLSTRVASFLAGWLTNHILVSDKLLGRQLLIAGYQN